MVDFEAFAEIPENANIGDVKSAFETEVETTSDDGYAIIAVEVSTTTTTEFRSRFNWFLETVQSVFNFSAKLTF